MSPWRGFPGSTPQTPWWRLAGAQLRGVGFVLARRQARATWLRIERVGRFVADFRFPRSRRVRKLGKSFYL
jgi:hypothetical protein